MTLATIGWKVAHVGETNKWTTSGGFRSKVRKGPRRSFVADRERLQARPAAATPNRHRLTVGRKQRELGIALSGNDVHLPAMNIACSDVVCRLWAEQHWQGSRRGRRGIRGDGDVGAKGEEIAILNMEAESR